MKNIPQPSELKDEGLSSLAIKELVNEAADITATVPVITHQMSDNFFISSWPEKTKPIIRRHPATRPASVITEIDIVIAGDSNGLSPRKYNSAGISLNI